MKITKVSNIKKNKYNFPSFLHLIISIIYTKIFHNNARIIRLPVQVKGGKYIHFGKNFTSGRYCRIDALEIKNEKCSNKIYFGNNVQINDKCHIAAIDNIFIDDNVLIASNVFISDHDHGTIDRLNLTIPPSERDIISSPIIIMKNVWIGENVLILKGVTIGEGSIVAAGAVVTKNIPSYSIVAGIPAKLINM